MNKERKRAATLGRLGEEKAASYLKSLGYVIIKRNWRDSRYGEIDIVAESKTDILFVEVRSRTVGGLLSGAETVDSHKLSRVKNAASIFMNRFNTNLPFRVDVIEMTYYPPGTHKNDKRWVLKHIKNV
ncbi:MAG: YraN family protein [Clostridia bacterium]|nr:YraN family protein [Clostridia bacterium]